MQSVEKIVNKLMRRPKKDKALIAEKLLMNLHGLKPEIESAWRREVRRRILQAERGQTTFIPWAIVKERLRRRYRAAA